MQPESPSPSHPQANLTTSPFRTTLLNAARFWEPRRLLYNLILTSVVIFWFAGTWPHFRPALVPSTLLPLSFLALLANICYSAAYLVDIPLQLSTLSAIWNRYRWLLWIFGILLALLLENYWIADEIYPDFH